jgi:hypothetical protein
MEPLKGEFGDEFRARILAHGTRIPNALTKAQGILWATAYVPRQLIAS